MYKLNKDQISGNISSISKFNEDGSGLCIPLVEDNVDYQEHLKWVEEGNTPLSAEEL